MNSEYEVSKLRERAENEYRDEAKNFKAFRIVILQS
jgi:hypothetical protein